MLKTAGGTVSLAPEASFALPLEVSEGERHGRDAHHPGQQPRIGSRPRGRVRTGRGAER